MPSKQKLQNDNAIHNKFHFFALHFFLCAQEQLTKKTINLQIKKGKIACSILIQKEITQTQFEKSSKETKFLQFDK